MANSSVETKKEPKQFHFDFIKNAPIFYGISIVLIIGIILTAIFKGVELDIQFKGGSLVTYSYTGEMDTVAAEAAVQEIIQDNVSVQFGTDMATGETTMVVSLPVALDSAQTTELTTGMQEQFPESSLTVLSTNNVDPTMGHQFLLKCVVALVLASVLMLVYIAFRFRKIGGWSAGVMSLIALLHDILIAFGVFVIAGIPINDNFIAVVLTILGFSLNDTIVIYDRIRENRGLLGSNVSFKDLVNTSINQSLTRSLVTSLCAILAMIVVTVVAIMYNVDSILSFSLPMVIGLISGSYSTICLVGPLWVSWKSRAKKEEKSTYYTGRTKKRQSADKK